MKNKTRTDTIATYYKQKWKVLKTWWHADKTLGIHFGYYDSTTKTFEDAIFRMNDYIADLLQLGATPKTVLDAGCGVGGTSIYLGKKFPHIHFVGVTITPEQVDLGKGFINQFQLKNVKIYLDDFHATQFPNNHFDAVFAVESVSYTHDIETFILEMKRILKPKGQLVVLDGFQSDVIPNPVLQTLFENYLYGRGYSKTNLPDLTSYSILLKKYGFHNIIIKDISNHVAKSQLRGLLIAIPFFFSYIVKRIITIGKYDREKNFFDYSMAVSLIAPLIALKHICRYYMTSANKMD